MAQSTEEIAKEITLALIERLSFKSETLAGIDQKNDHIVSTIDKVYKSVHRTVNEAFNTRY